MPTEDYLSLIELDVDLKQISLVFNYEKMMMMILLTGVYRLLTAHRTYLPPAQTLTEPTAEIHVDANCTPGVHAPTPMDARRARPHADGRPQVQAPTRWTPGVHAPQGGVHGRTWAYMGVHPTLYSKMSGWCCKR